MVDREILSECLKTVIDDQNTKTARDAIETMLKIHRNILYNAEDTNYRKLRLYNPKFLRTVWSVYPARQFMLISGWIEIEDLKRTECAGLYSFLQMKNLSDPVIIFNCDERLLDIIEILVDHRSIAPSEHEWEEGTKLEGKSESQLREEGLRRKANIEKQKDIEEFQKDKEYRERLAQSIKKQIESDKKRRKQLYTHPVVGNKLVKGARIQTFNSTPTPDARSSRQ